MGVFDRSDRQAAEMRDRRNGDSVSRSASGLMMQFNGISERRSAVQAACDGDEKYRSFFDHSLDGGLLTTPGGAILAANAAVCRLLQRSESELRLLGCGAVLDEDDPRLSALLDERGCVGFVRGEINVIRKDGRKIPVEVSSTLFTGRNGEPWANLSLRDLSERKRLNDRPPLANHNREEILKVVSHDLRNSLNAIGFIATELARQGGSPLATQIRCAATLADRLLADVGALTAIESGALVLGRVMAPVGSIVREVAELFRPLAAARAIELRAATPSSGLIAFVDRDRMVQAVSNVVANAVEVSPEGGRVDMAVKQTGDEIEFAVSDSGPGLQPGEVEQLFSRSRWGNDGRRRASVGLGLVISKNYVEAHGGRIRVQSRPGSGSTLFLVIPVRQPDLPVSERRPPRDSNFPSGC